MPGVAVEDAGAEGEAKHRVSVMRCESHVSTPEEVRVAVASFFAAQQGEAVKR